MKGFLTLILGFGLVYISQARIVYIHNGSTNGDGSSWSKAGNNLVGALDTASAWDTLWVAGGTYYPTTGTDRGKHFLMEEGITLLGGFSKGATSLAQRDWTKYRTILSGNIGKKGDSLDNSCNILVTGRSAPLRIGEAWLDGFEFTGGYADSTAHLKALNEGGGIHIYDIDLHISNCTFYYNYANSGGAVGGSEGTFTNCTFVENIANACGAVYMNWGQFYGCLFKRNKALDRIGALKASSTHIVDCQFIDNEAAGYAGAVFSGAWNIENCHFENNKALGDKRAHGGALFYSGSGGPQKIMNCVFLNNYSTGKGGAMYTYEQYQTFNDSLMLMGNVFNGNKTKGEGGAIYYYNGSLRMSSNVFMNNQSGAHGSAMYGLNKFYHSSTVFKNCSFWGNRSDSNSTVFFYNTSGPCVPSFINCVMNNNDSNTLLQNKVQPQFLTRMTLTRCIIDFDYPASDTLRRDPKFLKPSGQDGKLRTIDDHLYFKPFSIAINAGVDTSIHGNPPEIMDVDGNPRVGGKIIDIGAYEKTDCSQLRSPKIWIPSTFQCLGDSITIRDSLAPTGVMTWHASSGIDISTDQLYDSILRVKVNKTGMLKIWRKATLCDSFVIDSIVLNVKKVTQTPTIWQSEFAPFCQGDTLLISATNSFYEYKWSNGAKTDTLSLAVDTQVYLQVRDSNQCWSDTSSVLSYKFENLPKPPAVSYTRAKACSYDSILLTIDTNSVLYLWSDSSKTKYLSVSQTGVYKARIIDHNGCYSPWFDSIDIEIWQSLAKPTLLYDTLQACNEDTLWLRSDKRYHSIEWHDKDTGSLYAVVKPQLNFYRYQDANGCWSNNSDSATTAFRTNPVAKINTIGAPEFCQGDSVVLRADIVNDGSYLWSTSDSVSSIVVNQEKWVYLKVQDNYCSSVESDSIYIKLLPTPYTPEVMVTDDSICQGDTVILEVIELLEPYYKWTDGVNGHKRMVVSTTDLAVFSENTHGCRSHLSDSVHIEVSPLPDKPNLKITYGRRQLCYGDSCILEAPAGFDEYIWDLPQVSGALVTCKSPGLFEVSVVDENGCQSEFSNPIIISRVHVPKLEIEPTGDMSFCSGDSVKLTISSEFDEYHWSDGFNEKSRTFRASDTLWVWGVFNECPSDSQQIMTREYAGVDTPFVEHVLLKDNCSPSYRLSASANGLHYEWNLSGEKDRELTTNIPGEYTVRYADQHDCWSAWSKSYTISTLSFNPFSGAQVSLSPNPTTGHINLISDGMVRSSGITHIEGYDAIGRIVWEKEIGVFECKPLNEKLDLSHLGSGQYFLKIADEEHTKLFLVVLH